VPRVPLGKVRYCDHKNLALHNDVQKFEALQNVLPNNFCVNEHVKKARGRLSNGLEVRSEAARHIFWRTRCMSFISPRPSKLRRVLLTSPLRYPSMPISSAELI